MLLGGDFNADPNHSAYRKIASLMDSCADSLSSPWDQYLYYSWCHPHNSFTGSHCNDPLNAHQRRIDHFFSKIRKPEFFEILIDFYSVEQPIECSCEIDTILATNENRRSTRNSINGVSFSDHQPIEAYITILQRIDSA